MKAFTACVLISIVTLSLSQIINVNVTRGGSITLNGTYKNTTWTRYHLDSWKNLCKWNMTAYKCYDNGSITITATGKITSGKYKAESYKNEIKKSVFKTNKTTFEDSGNYEHQKITFYQLTIIQLPTTKVPTTTASTYTTQLNTTVQNSTVLVRYLLREESTTQQTDATLSAFSSTANLTSLAWTNETGVLLMHGQPYSGLHIQITFLVICGIFILVVLLYFVCCKARKKSRRPIYRPVIGNPQPFQVEGGLRNLLFSFSVW
ncbi:CR1 gamma protein [Human adenovirus 54]|uniref:29.1kDa protein n=2 Tax=Human mastadenovirus D TaxID=130310 RepID=B9A5N8_9ADEN|nr:29.3 kDa protein [Human adenovirus 54]BAC87854.1 E3A5 20.3k [Human adenovirus D8]BAH18902.2 29.3kDa protein [Human adenovirus 54]BAH84809.1 29.3 kDa protein [Human adenovirus 54]BAX64530.1 CR1 gamma protein [Human adenovirus 54]BAX64682.1 CR1 gamma protein [Human adenovirus 54]